MKSPQTIVALTAATLLLVVLFVLNLAMGSVSIPLADVWTVLTGNVTGEASDTWRFIIIESRLPQAIMALMGGAALAVSGLLLQTTFRNPLAGPDVFGINSGAALAVAVVMLGMGGSLSAGSLSLAGYAAVLFSALVGALAVTALISALSAVVRSSTMLLIIGLMIGYLANSAITLLNFFATSEGVKSYTVWGMGSFGNVSLASIPVAAVVIGLSSWRHWRLSSLSMPFSWASCMQRTWVTTPASSVFCCSLSQAFSPPRSPPSVDPSPSSVWPRPTSRVSSSRPRIIEFSCPPRCSWVRSSPCCATGFAPFPPRTA